MSFASRHNKGRIFTVDTTDYYYCKPADLMETNPEEKVYQIAGLYINTKGKFGDSPAAIIPELKMIVNLPAHMLDEVREIMHNPEDIDAINDGLVGIQFERYTSSKYNRDCIGVNWVDM